MNIFVTDRDAEVAAYYLCDVRARAMLRESVQMMSTAVHLLDPDFADGLYRPTHQNHPVTVWTRTRGSNFRWLLDHATALRVRVGEAHKSGLLLPALEAWFSRRYLRFPETEVAWHNHSPFVNAARNLERGVDFTYVADVHEAYRQYLEHRWFETDRRLPTWSHGRLPPWITNAHKKLIVGDSVTYGTSTTTGPKP